LTPLIGYHEGHPPFKGNLPLAIRKIGYSLEDLLRGAGANWSNLSKNRRVKQKPAYVDCVQRELFWHFRH